MVDGCLAGFEVGVTVRVRARVGLAGVKKRRGWETG